MQICWNCKLCMTCDRTGVIVMSNTNWAHAGDLYRCHGCGNQTAVCNPNGWEISPVAVANAENAGRLIRL